MNVSGSSWSLSSPHVTKKPSAVTYFTVLYKPAGCFLLSVLLALPLNRHVWVYVTRHLTLSGNPPSHCAQTLCGNLWLQRWQEIDLWMTCVLGVREFPHGCSCVLCVFLCCQRRKTWYVHMPCWTTVVLKESLCRLISGIFHLLRVHLLVSV